MAAPQMTRASFRYAFWIKHALVLIAAIALLWLAGLIPGMILGQESTAPPTATPDAGGLILGLISAWLIYIALANCQRLTFQYVKRFATPVFLAGVFILALLLAWRYATAAPI